MMENFKLISLKTHDKSGRNIDVSFIDTEKDYEDCKCFFMTLIIGNNGAGKSYILYALTSIFRQLESIIQNKKIASEVKKFEIEYICSGDKFKIQSIEGFSIEKNGVVANIDELKLPSRLLGSSFSVNDKFIYSDNDVTSIYKYLGIRGSVSGAGTKTHQKKIGEALINLSGSNDKYDYVKSVFEFLGYKSKVILKFKLRKINHFFSGHITFNEFCDYFANWRERSNRKTEPFYYKHYKDLEESNELYGLYDFFVNMQKLKNTHNFLIFPIDFSIKSNTTNIANEYANLKKMMLLDLISTPEIEIVKNKSFSLENASSGEFHVLFNLVNILDQIEPNSLILIDEPEISLHPEWQCQYVKILHRVLEKYSTCHVIIATHSHFMASDLQVDSSSITKISNNQKTIYGEIYDFNTYGWTVENILYNVFETKTNRNYYLEADIDSILKMVSNPEHNKVELQEIISKIDKLYLPKVDPLNSLIRKVKELIK